MSANPLHSWWWKVWHIVAAPAVIFGFGPVLIRSEWTKCHARIGLAFVGWRQ